jgi:hypothetical protein
MPSHGVEIIDGIPVILRNGEMIAFQPGLLSKDMKIKLGIYNAETHTATWQNTEEVKKWLEEYQRGMVSRSRK